MSVNNKKYAVLIAACLTLLGCVSPDVATVPFDATKATYINNSGRNSITGEAFRKRNDGLLVTCAGEEVSLFPVTEYAMQRVTHIYGSVNGGRTNNIFVNAGSADPQYLKYIRTTRCDSDGQFAFNGVADGDYYVVTTVVWNPTDSIIPEGGAHGGRVQVKGGKTVKLNL